MADCNHSGCNKKATQSGEWCTPHTCRTGGCHEKVREANWCATHLESGRAQASLNSIRWRANSKKRKAGEIQEAKEKQLKDFAEALHTLAQCVGWLRPNSNSRRDEPLLEASRAIAFALSHSADSAKRRWLHRPFVIDTSMLPHGGNGCFATESISQGDVMMYNPCDVVCQCWTCHESKKPKRRTLPFGADAYAITIDKGRTWWCPVLS